MASTFDIFSGRVDKSAIWVETVDGFGNAYELMTKLAAREPGRYFIISRDSHVIRGSINTSNFRPQTSSSGFCVRVKSAVPLL
jgi:hypothetical protein